MWFFSKPHLNKYGWRPSKPDHRDRKYAMFRPESKIARLPSSVDLRPFCSPVENQGDLGACTAHALSGAVEFLEMKNKRPFERVSRLFIYYNERDIENTVKIDSGAELRDGIKTLNKQGVCSEGLWPYIIPKFTKKPSCECYKDALNHTIDSYLSLSSINDMQQCLAAGYPFVFGFSVYSSFEADTVAKTGIVNMPGTDEQLLGGHAVLCVGYDNAKKTFIVRNSWGEDWGQKGYFTMPFDYLSNPNLASDFWTVRTAKGY